MKHILTGGFLAGFRTYLLGALVALQAVISWAVGDLSLAELIEQLPEILGGLGLMSLRAGVANTLADLARELANTKPPPKKPKPASGPALRSSAIGGVFVLFLAVVLTGCTTSAPETAREKLFAAEKSYAALVNTAATAIENGHISRKVAEDFDAGRQVVRNALDRATELIDSGKPIDAAVVIDQAAVTLLEVAAALEARTDE